MDVTQIIFVLVFSQGARINTIIYIYLHINFIQIIITGRQAETPMPKLHAIFGVICISYFWQDVEKTKSH